VLNKQGGKNMSKVRCNVYNEFNEFTINGETFCLEDGYVPLTQNEVFPEYLIRQRKLRDDKVEDKLQLVTLLKNKKEQKNGKNNAISFWYYNNKTIFGIGEKMSTIENEYGYDEEECFCGDCSFLNFYETKKNFFIKYLAYNSIGVFSLAKEAPYKAKIEIGLNTKWSDFFTIGQELIGITADGGWYQIKDGDFYKLQKIPNSPYEDSIPLYLYRYLAKEGAIEIYDRLLNQTCTLDYSDYLSIEYRDAGYIIASCMDYDCEYHNIYLYPTKICCGFAGPFEGCEVDTIIYFNEYLFIFQMNAIDVIEQSELVLFWNLNTGYKKAIEVNNNVEFNIGGNPNFVQIDGNLYDFRWTVHIVMDYSGKKEVKYQCFEENPENTDSIYTYDKSFFVIREIDGIPDTIIKYQ
jgi:hypothetical protein